MTRWRRLRLERRYRRHPASSPQRGHSDLALVLVAVLVLLAVLILAGVIPAGR